MADENSTTTDDEFDLDNDNAKDLTTAIERLKQFSYYLVENVELNLTLCLNLLEQKNVPSRSNSLYTTAISKLLSVIPKVGSGLGNALAKGEIFVFDKIDKKNSRILADLVYYFSDQKEEVRSQLIEASVDLFFSFEHQFMKLTCKGGQKRAMQKLAKDAADRMFNYLLEYEGNKELGREEISKGVLFGDSKRNRAGAKEGKTVMKGDNKWKTCKLYQKAGIVIVEEEIFFRSHLSKPEKYGYRRPLFWEKIEDIKETWEPDTCSDVPNYSLNDREDISKVVKDYIMTKNPFEEAKLERTHYSKEAAEDRKLKHEELLNVFHEHFKELLEELDQQYRIIMNSHAESKEVLANDCYSRSEEKKFQLEVTAKLEEIKQHISDTKVLIERNEAVREDHKDEKASSDNKIVEQEKLGTTELFREILRKNDPGPKIGKEVKRSLRKIGLKW